MKRFFFLLIAITIFFGYKKREDLSLWLAIHAEKPKWVQEQLASDFAPFLKISKKDLDETQKAIESQGVHVERFVVKNGKISSLSTQEPSLRAKQFQKILSRINRAKKLPDLDFLMCVYDGVQEEYHPENFWFSPHQAPLFAWAKKRKDLPYIILVPDFLTTKEGGWHREIAQIEKKYRTTPWKKRKAKGFWRGASNDKAYTLENIQIKPRFLISALSKEVPDLLDAGFSRVYPEEIESVVSNLGLILGNSSLVDHLDYKYLPLLDGFMCSFPGFQWRLLSGSLIFKQDSSELQYFYSALKPYEHYIPIRSDMSDLISQMQFAKEHDEKCQKIAENARRFALRHLMPNQIYAYLYWALEEYASRLH